MSLSQNICFWCKKPGQHKFKITKDDSNSEKESYIYLCDNHNAEMNYFKRKNVQKDQ